LTGGELMVFVIPWASLIGNNLPLQPDS